MRTIIPINQVSFDYQSILDRFISILQNKQSNNIKCIYLSGSYARGEATDTSDIDVFCIFHSLDCEVLYDVGYSARNTPVPYEDLEINAQCLSMQEFNSNEFKGWTEKSARILDSILLFGDDIFGESISIIELQETYKRYLADVLMSIRHYLSVDEPVEKLTYKKIKTYILKPLMFPLRMECYCVKGRFPLTISELEESLEEDEKFVIELYNDESYFNKMIHTDHKKVLKNLHEVVIKKLI
jgi:hypothetical protein